MLFIITRMDYATDYAEPLIEVVTSHTWSVDHPRHAMKAIQETVFKETGDDLSEADALIVLGRLLERKRIQTRFDPPAQVGKALRGRRAKYFRVPDNER
jgi:hypothetical protein